MTQTQTLAVVLVLRIGEFNDARLSLDIQHAHRYTSPLQRDACARHTGKCLDKLIYCLCTGLHGRCMYQGT